MSQQTIHGSKALASQIKRRRNELGITIEEAAARAGIGTKTWCRYEAGESIRRDKCKGLCKALNWRTLPDSEENSDDKLTVEGFKGHAAWSDYLQKVFGDRAAISFAAGSDILLDHIKADLDELFSMPAGTHIGQLNTSFLSCDLPAQFLMEYDYNFIFQMKCKLQQLRKRAKYGHEMIAHSVMEELILYLCYEEANELIELCGGVEDIKDERTEEWVFDLFDDMDIVTFLFSDIYVSEDHPYHFSHWNEDQFFMESEE